jgi:23S rRNA maturation-related 3'-5' exoribonuclease YhaM
MTQNYEEMIDNILQEEMSENAFRFWRALKEKIPPIWNRNSSATLKYHKKDDGHVATIAEHVYEMTYLCSKLMRIFDCEPKSKKADLLFLAVVLHDAFKYGLKNPEYSRSTYTKHDKVIGDTIVQNKELFLKLFNEQDVSLLEECVRYHSGKWSTDARSVNFSFNKLSPETFFIHMLDMLSANNLTKINGNGTDDSSINKVDS